MIRKKIMKLKLIFILICLLFNTYLFSQTRRVSPNVGRINPETSGGEHILSYDFINNLKYKFYNDNPNWPGLIGMIPLNNWSRNINDNSINIWRTPLDKNYPTRSFVDYVENSIARAESVVYIPTLWFTPGNSMEEALKRAISYLNQKSYQKQQPIRVRIIFSMFNASPIPTKNATQKVIDYLISDEISPYLDLSVICYRNPIAFNHSKIIAVDSNQLITGGMNFPDKDYDDLENPVNDLSIEFNLPYVADLGRIYLSKLALETKIGDEFSINSIACTNSEKINCNVSERWYELSNPVFNIFNINSILQSYNTDYILGAGKMMSAKEYGDAEVSTDSIISLMDNARYEINISQQSIRNIAPASTDIQHATCAALGRALMKGVKVNIILSSYSGQGVPFLGYAESSLSDSSTEKCIIRNAKDFYNLDVRGALGNLNILRVARWFNYTGYKYGTAKNHVKLIMVDDQMAYIGSENLYYNNHSEFGVIINSRLLMMKLKREYWTPTYGKSYSNYQSDSN